jgi:hypothetical protein
MRALRNEREKVLAAHFEEKKLDFYTRALTPIHGP